jgi:pyruvate,water dikinase
MPAEGGARLTGLGASSGVVEGKARVLRRIDELEALVPGEIIVAPTTDVGWTPLFLLAAGVVTELGGPLSHAAVVAREFGVPSVVNVEGVTRAVRTGDRLRIDGDRGTVDLLPRDT